MATKPVVVSLATTIVFAARNTIVKAVALCAAAATSTLEVFDGFIGTIATAAVGAGGTGYVVGDAITLVSSGGGVQATFTVAAETVGVVTGLTLVSGGTGYTAAATYATTTNSIAGAGLTVTASTVTDAGTSIGKISVVANESRDLPINGLTTNGVSVRLTGASAKGYVYHE